MLDTIYRFAGERDPVVVVITAVSMVVTGGLIILHPPLMAWVLGLALVLGGVALVVATVAGSQRGRA